MNLSDASQQYIQFLNARGLAESTVGTAKKALSNAAQTWGDIPISDIQPRHIDSFFMDRKWSTGTRNIYLLALRSFLRWCRTHRYLPPDYDPTEGWKSRPLERRERTWLTLPVLQALMETTTHARDRIFIAVGIYTFLRASEITNLRIGDIDLDKSELKVYRIKTKQNDRLPICLELQVELTHWLHYYQNECGELSSEWYLIPARGPAPMKGVLGKRTFIPTGEPHPLRPTCPVKRPQRVIKAALDRLGINKHGDGCHVLRRSGARALYEQLRDMGHDGSARRVQSMLGHQSLIMTEKYLGIDHERMQRNEALAGKPMFSGPSFKEVGGQLLAIEQS